MIFLMLIIYFNMPLEEKKLILEKDLGYLNYFFSPFSLSSSWNMHAVSTYPLTVCLHRHNQLQMKIIE